MKKKQQVRYNGKLIEFRLEAVELIDGGFEKPFDGTFKDYFEAMRLVEEEMECQR